MPLTLGQGVLNLTKKRSVEKERKEFGGSIVDIFSTLLSSVRKLIDDGHTRLVFTAVSSGSHWGLLSPEIFESSDSLL